MAIITDGRPRAWIIPVVVASIGIASTLALWQAAQETLQQFSRNQAALVHDSVHLHLTKALTRHEALASALAYTLAGDDNPQQTLEAAARPLLWRFPELIAIERYATDGQSPQSLRQVQLVSRGSSRADSSFQPFNVTHWRPVIERVWYDMRPGTTAAGADSSVGSDANSNRRTVHLFWPVPERETHRVPGRSADEPATNSTRQILGLVLGPEQLLAPLLRFAPTSATEFQIFDLNSQAIDPIVTASASLINETEPAFAVEDAVVHESRMTLAGRTWLLRSSFAPDAPAQTHGLLQSILVIGFALTLVLALLSFRLAGKLGHYRNVRASTEKRLEREHRSAQNASQDRDMLSRALLSSGQRTRDFIELGDAFACELDEDLRISFISPQIEELIHRPAAELTGHDFLDLFSEKEKDAVANAFRTGEQERTIIHLDTVLLQSEEDGLPVTLRLKPVVDALNRIEGFRALGWRR